MGTIYYLCEHCDSDGNCYPREMVHVAKGGEWVCENCYDDCPEDFAEKRPADNDNFEYPRWRELPEVPNYVPEVAVTIG